MDSDDEFFPSQLEQLLPELQEDDQFQDDLRYDASLSSLIGVERDTYRKTVPNHVRYLLDSVSQDDPLRDNSPSKPYLPSLKGPPFMIREMPGKGMGAVATRRIPAGSIVLDDPFVLSIQVPTQEPASEEEAIEQLSIVLVQLIGQYVKLPIDTRRQLAALHPHIKAGTRGWFQSHMIRMGVEFDDSEVDFVVRLYCTFNTNVFSKALPGGGLNWRIGRLFLTTSRINHACQPNTKSSQTSNGHKVVTAVRDTEEGEELTLRYLDHKLFSRSEWQAQTQQIWGFTCNCPGCESK
ncbi:hypothetical protein Daus18300_009280 [Diaporthe australafricana]|uniref:SET domain-containing protein n=1 Tax=Diaporthe australafricana TaxID=127596 RepID=A0ABR3WF42_9PEZI